MDPNQCLLDILDQLSAGSFDRSETVENLRNLATWLEAGGFCPLISNQSKIVIHGVDD
jgi:hypothetical protein